MVPIRTEIRRLRAIAATVLAIVPCALGLLASPASASSEIEGVWSFNGGSIAVREQAPGSFAGTVVSPTRFSLCTHPAGERIWTQMVRQSDGSYWGFHNWFFETPECIRNPALGQTAWRVLQNAQGRFLRACFSEPGSELQPTIAADGAVSDATFGCADSALIAEVPDLSPCSAAAFVSAPPSSRCLQRRTLRVLLRDPANDPIARVVVVAAGGGVKAKAKLRDTSRGVVARLNLERLPEVFTLRVRLTTVLGRHLRSKNTYHRCRSGGSK